MFARNFIRTFFNANLNTSQNYYASNQNITNITNINSINSINTKEQFSQNRYFSLALQPHFREVTTEPILVKKTDVQFVLDLEENELADILPKNLYISLENGHFE
jgi:hypothetical protein